MPAARPASGGPRPPLTLDSEATYLKGAGPAVAMRLRTLGIERVRDLLFHLPLRYEDRRAHQPIAQLRHGDDALVRGRIVGSDVRFAGRRTLRVQVDDGSGTLLLRFFHFNEAQRANLAEGRWLQAYGSVRVGGAHFKLTFLPPLEPVDTGDEDADLLANVTMINNLIEPIVREHLDQWFYGLDFDFAK